MTVNTCANHHHLAHAGLALSFPRARATRLAVSLSLALIGTLTLPQALAQTASDEAATNLDAVTVTGSRLMRRSDLSAPSPTTVISREDIALSDSATIENVLNEFPQLAAGNTSAVNNGGGAGVLTANLRGLGATRTLTLVNGRRFMAATSDGVVDLASIPDALIENVEIITGGASAVYGSDAIAGAVNFLLRKDFQGLEASYSHGETSKSDGGHDKFDLTVGGNIADGRGNAVLSISRTERDPVIQGRRDFSKVALDTSGGELVPGGSGSIPGTRIGLNNAQLASLIGVDLTPSGACTAVTGVRFDETGKPVPNCTPQDLYNYAEPNYLQRPLERTQITALANYQVNDAVEVYGEAYYSNSRNQTQLAPEAIILLTPGAPASTLLIPNYADNPVLLPNVRDFLVNNSHVFDPDDTGTAAIVGSARRFDELGPRFATYERISHNIVGGLRGDFETHGGHWWRWDTYFQEQRTRTDTVSNNVVNASRLALALDATVDANGNLVCANPISGCVPTGVLGLGSVNAGAAAFLTPQRASYQIFERSAGGASISGSMFDLPAGSVAMAFGAEYRRDEFRSQPSPMDVAGEYGANSTSPMAGRYSIQELFAEFRVPLLAGARFAHDLAIEGAVRYSDYSTIGGVNTWKIGAEWAPSDWLRVRSAYNVAIRAPSLNELYAPQSRGYTPGVDPCAVDANPTSAQKQLCIQQGISAAEIDTFTQGTVGFERTTGGNPDLTEEKSRTFTIGTVFSIPAIEGLNVAVDYFTVEVEDAITSITANQMLADCFTRLDPAAPSCQAVIRLPNGQIDDVRSIRQNIGLLKASGLDFQIDYRFQVPWGVGGHDGQISLMMLNSWLFERSMEVLASQGKLDCAGYMGGGCGGGTGNLLVPDLKVKLSAGYRSGPLSVRLQGQMIDKIELRPGITAAVAQSPRQWYFGTNAAYDVNQNLQLFAGVDNLFDRAPPILGTALAGESNTDVALYDVLGRRYFVGLKVTF